MLNFIIAAFGEADITLEFIERMRLFFRKKFSPGKVNVYDFEYLRKNVRSHPEYLNSSSKFKFSLYPTGFEKEYCGFFKNNDIDIFSIYDKLFLKPKMDDLFSLESEQIPYSEEALFNSLRFHLKSNECIAADEPIYDFWIGFKYKKVEVNTFYAQIKFGVDPECSCVSVEEYVSWFEQLVAFCDVNFPSCFHSAYISMNPKGWEISHGSLFSRYDHKDIYGHLFGCEWYGYICKRIADTLTDGQCSAIYEISEITEYLNGFSYKSKIPLDEFKSSDSLELYRIFEDKLLPGVAFWNWCDFAADAWRLSYPIKEVKVYQNMLGDKSVMIPFKCSPRKREALVDLDYLVNHKTYKGIEL